MFNHLWHPNWFQGNRKLSHYFEGWYYKLSDRDQENTLAFIPGIALGQNQEQAMSFIQVLHNKNHTIYFSRYTPESFTQHYRTSEIALGNSCFSTRKIKVDLTDDISDTAINGEISFCNQLFWPGSCFSPGIMGPFSFAPFMECHHHIASLQHDLTGLITIGDNTIDFSGGRGYIEKDWGSSFPNTYLWAHSNYFDARDAGFTLSVARIPLWGRYFNGFFAVLWHNGQLYRWTTYNRSKLLSFYNSPSRITVRFGNHKHRMIVTIYPNTGARLKSPVKGQMSHSVYESMDSTIEILLQETNTSRTLWKGISRCGCVEVCGDIAGLSP